MLEIKSLNTILGPKHISILSDFNTWCYVVSMGESAQLAPSSGCYVVSSTNLSCKSFKIRVNFWIEVLRSYRHMLPTSFLDNFHPLSMRCSLNLQLRSAHEKPQQPNRPDSPIDAMVTLTW